MKSSILILMVCIQLIIHVTCEEKPACLRISSRKHAELKSYMKYLIQYQKAMLNSQKDIIEEFQRRISKNSESQLMLKTNTVTLNPICLEQDEMVTNFSSLVMDEYIRYTAKQSNELIKYQLLYLEKLKSLEQDLLRQKKQFMKGKIEGLKGQRDDVDVPIRGNTGLKGQRDVDVPIPGNTGLKGQRDVDVPNPGNTGLKGQLDVDVTNPGNTGLKGQRNVDVPNPGNTGLEGQHDVDVSNPDIQLCPLERGYAYKPEFKICYKIYPTPVIEIDADSLRSRCSRDGAELIKINSQPIQEFFNEELGKLEATKTSNIEESYQYVLIQGNDNATEGEWVYDDWTPLTYFNWNSGQPERFRSQNIIGMKPKANFKWHDLDTVGEYVFIYVCQRDMDMPNRDYQLCPLKRGYVYKPEFKICYKIYPTPNRIDADSLRNRCSRDGAQLIKINSKAIQEFFNEELGKLEATKTSNIEEFYQYVLIQGNDNATEGEWVYDDGTPLTYINWNSGQPERSLRSQNILGMNPKATFKWHDLDTVGEYVFIYVCQIVVG